MQPMEMLPNMPKVVVLGPSTVVQVRSQRHIEPPKPLAVLPKASGLKLEGFQTC